MDRIGIAVVGCYGMAKAFHLPAIVLLPDLFELVAVCDRVPERAEETGRRYGVPAYTDARVESSIKRVVSLRICRKTRRNRHTGSWLHRSYWLADTHEIGDSKPSKYRTTCPIVILSGSLAST